jgi:stearoyl-CoA desaturase (delta-9 desaturase)
MSPGLKRFVLLTGNWLTGIEPKTWICMHRRHHLFADKPLDPHSPQNHSIPSIIWVQLKSYEKTTEALGKNERKYTRIVQDLDFPVHFLNRHGLWFVPHLCHLGLAIFIAVHFNAYIFGACYWLGMNGHPVQGWLVNAFGHSKGYRNYNTPDCSTNNLPVGYLVMGEGFQNNHHHDSRQANFSVRWWEIDTGYWLCKLLAFIGLVTFNPRIKILTRRVKKVA